MRYWEHPGLKTTDNDSHTIVGTVAVDPSNLNECRIAIDEFVDLQIGIALPVTAQGQTEWTVVGDGKTGNSAPGSWGGHGIPYREYDAETFKCVTWGGELLLTVPFHQDYAQEAHVVVTQEMLSKQGLGPSGVAWTNWSPTSRRCRVTRARVILRGLLGRRSRERGQRSRVSESEPACIRAVRGLRRRSRGGAC